MKTDNTQTSLDFLNIIAEQLTNAGFIVEEPSEDLELLDVWNKPMSEGGCFIEIYLCAHTVVHGQGYGVFSWDDHDIEVIENDCRELIAALQSDFDKPANDEDDEPMATIFLARVLTDADETAINADLRASFDETIGFGGDFINVYSDDAKLVKKVATRLKRKHKLVVTEIAGV